jgi:hypothetical protein
VLLNPDQSRKYGPLVKIQGVLGDLLEPVGDAIGKLPAHGSKGAEEDHEVESASQDLDGRFLHFAFK